MPSPEIVLDASTRPWIAATNTRAWCLDDPLLDWLDIHGRSAGWKADYDEPGYDARTDMGRFLSQQGELFEAGVLSLLRERGEILHFGPSDPWTERVSELREAMVARVPIIAQAPLVHEGLHVRGLADLLVRADVLDQLFPTVIDGHLDASSVFGPWHYRVVEIKFSTLDLRLDDSPTASNHLAHMTQAWLYNETLGALQGFTPPASYLLGRNWKNSHGRGSGCLERLAVVAHDRTLGERGMLADVASDAVAWRQRVLTDGATWQILPKPSLAELYPNAGNREDSPWHRAKSVIATELAELTRLPGINPKLRRLAHVRGIWRMDEPGLTAESLEVARDAGKCEAALRANDPGCDGVVWPAWIERADPVWRNIQGLEFYVDFETVSNLDDDFSRLPAVGGQALIFQIGCGHEQDGEWRFRQWTVGELTPLEEARILGEWVGHMNEQLAVRELNWSDSRIVHYSSAELSMLQGAYNSAQSRQSGEWPELEWYDLLKQVIGAEPLGVRGAYGHGLKAVTRAMADAGLIDIAWGDGPGDGLGAMVGAWWAAAEARRTRIGLGEIELMKQIGDYNETDCRAMYEVLRWLRANR